MNKNIKRSLAVLSTATMLIASAFATSMTASAADESSLTVDKKVVPVGTTQVEYSFYVKDNLGWAAAGFAFDYDERLDLVLKNADNVKVTKGALASDLTVASSSGLNAAGTPRFTLGFAGTDVTEGDGVIASVLFNLPADAKAGDRFEIKLSVEKFNDNNATAVPYTLDGDGYIEIEAAATTTSTAATTAGTTAATTAATTGAATTAKVNATTAKPTTTAAATTTAASVAAPTTGVNGAALGLVGLLTAAGAAIVLKKKKD